MTKKEKKSGLEKLIELLNEYENTLEPNLQVRWTVLGIEATPELIVGKKFGFIQWLVENEKVEENSDLITLASELGCAFSSDVLLMYLAIQDNPIEFLVSILK